MRKIASVLAICAWAPFCVGAQDNPAPPSEHSQHDQHGAPSPDAAPGGHSMSAMHEHMQMMREQMTRIHATENPAERERLMQQHMQSMQQHMQMMGSMGCRQDVPAAEPRP